MNTLSWMIYSAEVFSRISPLLAVAGGFLIVAGAVSTLFGIVPWSYYSWDGDDHKKACEALRGKLRKNGKLAAVVGVPCIFLSAAIPSSSTIYLIAASEAGEAVVTSPDGREMLDDLKSVIRKKLKEELGETSDDIKT